MTGKKGWSKPQKVIFGVLLIIIVAILLIINSDASNSVQPSIADDNLHYKIIKQKDSKMSSGMDIQINERYSKEQLISIATKLRVGYPEEHQVSFDFWLKGQLPGKQFAYAFVFYPIDPNLKEKAVNVDKNEIPIEFKRIGLPAAMATKILSIQPANPQYKTILGKFVNDVTESVIIVYTDMREKKDQIFIGKYYLDNPDSPNLISPLIQKGRGGNKWICNEENDYYILQDSSYVFIDMTMNTRNYAIDQICNCIRRI